MLLDSFQSTFNPFIVKYQSSSNNNNYYYYCEDISVNTKKKNSLAFAACEKKKINKI